MRKIGLFIDGSNLHASCTAIGIRVDFVKLLEFFKKEHEVVRAFYFTALPPKEVRSSLRPMVDFIQHHGYTVITKETKTYYDENSTPKLKGNMDMDLAMYVWKYHHLIDEVVLFSGDGDFKAMVERVQECGKTCHVVSTVRGPVASSELRRQADKYTDLTDIQQYVTQVRAALTVDENLAFRRRRFLAGE